ncbi:MAG: HAD hydrolase family protein [Treponema sp.]|nr:HAD hydrolase family protein [Treponema sp.]
MDHSQKAIFLDIDETLITKSQGPFPDDLGPIEEVHQRGHKIFLSTGRSLGHIPQALREAPWLDGIIAGAGALVMLGGETLYHKWVPAEILPPICAFYFKQDKFCIFEGVDGVYGINLPERLPWAGTILPVTREDDLQVTYSGPIISKLTIGGAISGAEQKLLGDYFHLNAFENYFEGILLGESKARGMFIALKALDIPRENSIAIGDSRNDVDIIRAAGLGIAMGNASEELKALAAAVTGDCGKGGVGQAIVKYVL